MLATGMLLRSLRSLFQMRTITTASGTEPDLDAHVEERTRALFGLLPHGRLDATQLADRSMDGRIDGSASVVSDGARACGANSKRSSFIPLFESPPA
jgi:hypothetical protein